MRGLNRPQREKQIRKLRAFLRSRGSWLQLGKHSQINRALARALLACRLAQRAGKA